MLSNRVQNVAYIKILGTENHKKIKIVRLRSVLNSGFEVDKNYISDCVSNNDCKLDESISRAKSKIFELAFCNNWDYFFTATLDPSKYDRTNLELFHSDLTQWLRNQGKKNGKKIDFLLIPELHSDLKSWHMHGFISGVSISDLKQFVYGDKMGQSLVQKVLNGDIVYNWLSYSKKFGFCSLEPIKSPEAVSKYVTKYICKDLAKSVSEVGAHMYYHSRGLKTSELIKKGMMSAHITPNFENEYVQIVEIPFSDEAFKYWLSLID